MLLRFRHRARSRRAPLIARQWERVEESLLILGGVTTGNRVEVIHGGDAFFFTLWDAMRAASERIWIEMYTFADDSVGERTLEELRAAAARGCEVRLLFDAIGSPKMSQELLAPLRAAGGRAEVFNPLRRWRPGRSLFNRDHRKIIIIDDRMAFCGGRNISCDYAGCELGNDLFYDCQLQLEGPCVGDLALLCAQTLRRVGLRPGHIHRPNVQAGESVVQVLASSGSRGRRHIQRAMLKCINHAVERCWITTPYFLPPQRLRRAIVRAARRGVDVRIITAGVSDVPIVRVAAQHIYGAFVRNRVRLYELSPRTLHAKIITIDGVVSMVGSFNLDFWSDRYNLEVKVLVLDDSVARQMETRFKADLNSSQEVTDKAWSGRGWWSKLICWAAYQCMRV